MIEPTVVIGRPEGILSNGPPWREDDEIAKGNSRLGRRAGQHREDAWVLEIEIIVAVDHKEF